jgi:hypothetical protein
MIRLIYVKQMEANMIADATIKMLKAQPWGKEFWTEEALEHAITVLAELGGDENILTAKALLAVYEQRGCETLDPACQADGKLTHFIDVVVYG